MAFLLFLHSGSAYCGASYTVFFAFFPEIPWLICSKTGGLRRTLVGLGWLGLGVACLYTFERRLIVSYLSLSSSLLIPLLSRFWQAAQVAGWPHACVVLLLPRFLFGLRMSTAPLYNTSLVVLFSGVILSFPNIPCSMFCVLLLISFSCVCLGLYTISPTL